MWLVRRLPTHRNAWLYECPSGGVPRMPASDNADGVEAVAVTTLIHVGNSEGTVGRCDAKCYGATHGACSCICGGINYSKGLDQARENTLTLAREQLKVIEARGGYVADEIRQQVLL
jgi:hypothetical protein